MTNIVLDSSIFVKLFLEEDDTKTARDLITTIITEEHTILVPEIFNYEVFSAYCSNKESKIKLKTVYDWLKKCRPYITKSPLTEEVIEQAIDMTNHGHKKSGYPHFYDSIYHAIAIQEGCVFITANEKHFAKTHKKFGHIKLLKNV